MLHYGFIAATWLIGVGGAAGAAAAIVGVIFLGPAAVQAIIVPIFKRFIACGPCVVLTAALLATVGAYWVGHHTAVKDCRDEKANSIIAAQRADNIAANKAAADEANRAIDIEVNSDAQHKLDLATIEGLKGRPNASCAFDDDDIGGMLPSLRAAAKKTPSRAKPALEGTRRAVAR